jgi:hypothetical protein
VGRWCHSGADRSPWCFHRSHQTLRPRITAGAILGKTCVVSEGATTK